LSSHPAASFGSSGRSRRSHRARPHRARNWFRLGLILAAVCAVLALSTALAAYLSSRPLRQLSDAIEAQVDAGGYPPAVARFYALRDYQPLWIEVSGAPPFWRRLTLRPETQRIAGLAGDARAAAAARTAIARAADHRPATLARAELATSLALGAYVQGLAPHGPEPLAFIDPDLARPTDAGAVLDQAASAPSLSSYVSAVAEVNPVYRDLRAGLDRYRNTWSRLPQVQIPSGPALRLGDQGPRVAILRTRLGLSSEGALFDQGLAQSVSRFQAAHGLSQTGELDLATLGALNAGSGHYEQLILDNLQRARDLPPVFARRFVLVNVAARQLWVYEDGRPKHAMRVVVGTRDEPTPTLVGQLRYLVFNPYWNIPVDLVRTSVAPRVLKDGPGYLKTAKLEVLSDWSATAQTLAPSQVDWDGVSKGWQELRVRQLPGGGNMMGHVKFMAPNPLGIYLHDTPNRAAFNDPQRLLSSGCVRLESADALAQWLLGALPDVTKLGPDQQADLPQPTPVYITYLTAAPGPSGVTFHPDVYGKDTAQHGAAGQH
jgi:murein L,D-transpeptidase YcbB/YkuD